MQQQHSADWLRAIKHAVVRISTTAIVPGATAEELRDAIAARVRDVAKPTYIVAEAVDGGQATDAELWGIRDDEMGFLRTFKTQRARDDFYAVASHRYIAPVLFGPAAGAHPVEVQPTASDAQSSNMDAAWAAFQSHPTDHAGDHDEELHKAVEAAVRAATPTPLPAAPAVQGWMPIESAPKDDGLIDIWIPHAGNEGARWVDCYYDRICDEWRTVDARGYLTTISAKHVSHWMRRPAAPATPIGEVK